LELVQQRLNGPETSEVTQNVESDPSVVGLGGARAPNVFLSHASEDAELAKSVAEALTQHGIENQVVSMVHRGWGQYPSADRRGIGGVRTLWFC
jgi:hypothetical protein